MELIATRASALAMVQARQVRDRLAVVHPDRPLDLIEIRTSGDRLQDISLEGLEGTGFFTDALEEALLAGQAALAVHSLKDLPVQLGEQFTVAAVLQREDPRDVLVSRYGGLRLLPPGARVGTDSSRRRAQVALARPDLVFDPVRGNVPTRLAKLDAGEYDALILAAAGLNRLGLGWRATESLGPEVCLPAPGQGAIAIETLKDSPWAQLVLSINDAPTQAAVSAERAFLAGLGGGCRTPIGALAEVSGNELRLTGIVVGPEGVQRVTVAGRIEDALALGGQAAQAALAQGARP